MSSNCFDLFCMNRNILVPLWKSRISIRQIYNHISFNWIKEVLIIRSTVQFLKHCQTGFSWTIHFHGGIRTIKIFGVESQWILFGLFKLLNIMIAGQIFNRELNLANSVSNPSISLSCNTLSKSVTLTFFLNRLRIIQ